MKNYNVVDDSSTKNEFQPKQKMYMLQYLVWKEKKNEAKTFGKYFSCDCKCQFDSTICSSNLKWNDDKCHCECKKYHM